MAQDGDGKARKKRDKAKEAIALALASRWQDAAVLNRELIDEFPRDVEAHNRLGKALSELGQYRGRQVRLQPHTGDLARQLHRSQEPAQAGPAERGRARASARVPRPRSSYSSRSAASPAPCR